MGPMWRPTVIGVGLLATLCLSGCQESQNTSGLVSAPTDIPTSLPATQTSIPAATQTPTATQTPMPTPTPVDLAAISDASVREKVVTSEVKDCGDGVARAVNLEDFDMFADFRDWNASGWPSERIVQFVNCPQGMPAGYGLLGQATMGTCTAISQLNEVTAFRAKVDQDGWILCVMEFATDGSEPGLPMENGMSITAANGDRAEFSEELYPYIPGENHAAYQWSQTLLRQGGVFAFPFKVTTESFPLPWVVDLSGFNGELVVTEPLEGAPAQKFFDTLKR